METIDPEEIIFCITMLDVLRAIERRLGKEEANNLSDDDLLLAREEVVAVLEHSLDIRDLLETALDAWDLVRQL